MSRSRRPPPRTTQSSRGGEDFSDELYKPVVVGSYAQWLQEDSSTQRTHHWTLYLMGLDDEDLSYFIDKVVFYLHESFPDSARTISRPPYQVSEYGWGEFEAKVRIFFKGGYLKPVELHHYLKLYDNPEALPTPAPVIHNVYDELVFIDPPEDLRILLEAGPRHTVSGYSSSFDPVKLAQTEDKELVKLLKAHQNVLQRIYYNKKRLETAENNLVAIRGKMHRYRS